jgi:hypothetical protein
MPVYSSQEVRPQEWEACRQRARRDLIAKGFEPLSKKLGAAANRLARRYYYGL